MSVRAISWAYGLNLGSMTQKAVLLYLAYLGDQELAAVDFHGDVVPVNRRPKVWTLRLDASTESFNGVERAGDVQTAYTGRSVRS